MVAPAVSSHWLRPLGALPPGVHALFTTRGGGCSEPPFDSLNLGDHVQDDHQAVVSNRALLRAELAAQPVFLKQVHGTNVVHLRLGTADGTEADACVADQPDMACTIMVADCLPVLFAHASGTVVAAAHAGWRGLASGVLEQTFSAYAELVQNAHPGLSLADVASQTWVWLGPCIGPDAFEVGPEVREAFVASDAGAESMFRPTNSSHEEKRVEAKYLANLSGLARLRLQALGLPSAQGNDGSTHWCTVSDASSFFSHRRDAASLGSTGRMAACIWIEG